MNTNASLTRAIANRTIELEALRNPIVQYWADRNPDCDLTVYARYNGQVAITLTCALGIVEKDVPLEDVADYAYENGYVASKTLLLHEDDQITVRQVVTAQKDFQAEEKRMLRAIGKLKSHRTTRSVLLCAA